MTEDYAQLIGALSIAVHEIGRRFCARQPRFNTRRAKHLINRGAHLVALRDRVSIKQSMMMRDNRRHQRTKLVGARGVRFFEDIAVIHGETKMITRTRCAQGAIPVQRPGGIVDGCGRTHEPIVCRWRVVQYQRCDAGIGTGNDQRITPARKISIGVKKIQALRGPLNLVRTEKSERRSDAAQVLSNSFGGRRIHLTRVAFSLLRPAY